MSGLIAVTRPPVLMVATVVSILVYFATSTVVKGNVITFSEVICPATSKTSLFVNFTEIAGTPTFMLHVNVVTTFVPSLTVTVMTAFPISTPRTTPFADTLAISSSLDL